MAPKIPIKDGEWRVRMFGRETNQWCISNTNEANADEKAIDDYITPSGEEVAMTRDCVVVDRFDIVGFPTCEEAQAILNKYLVRQALKDFPQEYLLPEDEFQQNIYWHMAEKLKKPKPISKPKLKGSMMIKKALHRITVIWCLYGIVRVCIWVNPLLFKLWPLITREAEYGPSEPWNSSSGDQIACVWFATIIGLCLLMAAYYAVHHFANWFFNSPKKGS